MIRRTDNTVAMTKNYATGGQNRREMNPLEEKRKQEGMLYPDYRKLNQQESLARELKRVMKIAIPYFGFTPAELENEMRMYLLQVIVTNLVLDRLNDPKIKRITLNPDVVRKRLTIIMMELEIDTVNNWWHD